MYCGADLPVVKIETAPRQRAIETHERAFNAILEPARGRVDENTSGSLAAALSLEASEAASYIHASKRVPIARCQTRHEAELIATLVRTCGLNASVVADEELRLDFELIRARRVARENKEVHVHHVAGVEVIPSSEIRVMVAGLLRSKSVEYAETRPSSRNTGGLVDSAEFQGDEMLLDVYTNRLEQSFRIRADAFDYAGLVWPLSFRAEANFQVAVGAIHGLAPQAVVDDDFPRMRGLLARAWPERSRTEARGIKRSGLSLRPVAQSSVVSDNRDQFDRYSRLIFLSCR
ncbi:MAG: hypothetical protein DMF61_12470 [Blastocatellia bacterium AA13]|nr:MAG: hypothetical protein DMF61_12470 [Blastocatellia bacterium AA13]